MASEHALVASEHALVAPEHALVALEQALAPPEHVPRSKNIISLAGETDTVPPPNINLSNAKLCWRGMSATWPREIKNAKYGGWPFVLVPRLYTRKSPAEKWDMVGRLGGNWI